MRNKLLLLILFIPTVLKADIIYSPYSNNHIALSFEWIYSYEFSFSKYNTIAPWGGIGIVSSTNSSFNPSIGIESGFELRHYFKASSFRGFNVGLYGGFAYMSNFEISHAKIIHDYNSLGIVPGIKLTYKHLNKKNKVIEPYVGISNPFHKKLNIDRSIENIGLMLTIGIRIGINKVKKYNYVT